MTMLFIFVKYLPDPIVCAPGSSACESEAIWRENLGYNKPILVQYGIYLKLLFTQGQFGVGFKMYQWQSVTDVVFSKMAPTMYVNFWSLILAIPVGLGLGIFAALKKNKWEDQVISVVVMIIPPKGDAFAARNKYAMKIDFEQQPPRFVVSPTHWAATWLLAKGAPKVEPPAIVTERIARMTKRNAEKERQ